MYVSTATALYLSIFSLCLWDIIRIGNEVGQENNIISSIIYHLTVCKVQTCSHNIQIWYAILLIHESQMHMQSLYYDINLKTKMT